MAVSIVSAFNCREMNNRYESIIKASNRVASLFLFLYCVIHLARRALSLFLFPPLSLSSCGRTFGITRTESRVWAIFARLSDVVIVGWNEQIICHYVVEYQSRFISYLSDPWISVALSVPLIWDSCCLIISSIPSPLPTIVLPSSSLSSSHRTVIHARCDGRFRNG